MHAELRKNPWNLGADVDNAEMHVFAKDKKKFLTFNQKSDQAAQGEFMLWNPAW